MIFGAETWVPPPHMGRFLGGFQYQVVQLLTGRVLQQRTDRKWEYTSTVLAREEAGFEVMEEYIRRRQNTVAEFIAI